MGESLDKILDKELGQDMSIRKYLDILGYATSTGVIGLVVTQATVNLYLHNQAVVSADLGHFNEWIIELPIMIYTLGWGLKKLSNYY